MTDLLRLGRVFSFARYRTDLHGFGLAWGVVAAFLVLALVLSWAAARL